MTELELAISLETAFRSFGYTVPFDSDTIRIGPGEAVIQGLSFLQSISVISEKEQDEHTANYKIWGEMPLRDVMADANYMDQIIALQEMLQYWRKRNSKRISQEITEQKERENDL